MRAKILIKYIFAPDHYPALITIAVNDDLVSKLCNELASEAKGKT